MSHPVKSEIMFTYLLLTKFLCDSRLAYRPEGINMMVQMIVPYLLIFLLGINIGSFINVCIYRIPKKKSIVTTRSHCINCGYRLRWYDLIPLLSFLLLRGRCRNCKGKIPFQYPAIEALNGILYVIVIFTRGVGIESIIYCLVTSALIVISFIDIKTYEIPYGINLFIGCLGLFRLILDYRHALTYLLGFISVSGFLYLLYMITKGKGIGGGDIKLMAVSGLVLGLPYIVLAFVFGCIIGSVIHILIMKLFKAGKVLAFGPYLSIGIYISMIYGTQVINWYLALY